MKSHNYSTYPLSKNYKSTTDTKDLLLVAWVEELRLFDGD